MSGERLRGELLLMRIQPLHEAINKPEQFLEFRVRDGRILMIAKSAIELVTEVELPDVQQLDHMLAKLEPHGLLGVAPGSDPAAIRDAYLAKVRKYHPDTYASIDLPSEVAQYLEGMFVHIKAAYDEIGPRGAARRADRLDAEREHAGAAR